MHSKAITQLLAEVRAGDRTAADQLFELVYEDLKLIARRQVSAGGGTPTLSTTALVHETYLKLVDRSRVQPQDRRHFFATAARAMRQILVDHARVARAQKRGGGATPVSSAQLENVALPGNAGAADRWTQILGVDRALDRLSVVDGRVARVVELRYFAGLSVDEVADLLEVSSATVKRDWRLARAFLYQQLVEDESEGSS